MSPSNIEWTEETWNPTIGCDRISPGCANCYARTMAARLKTNPKMQALGIYQRDGGPASGPGFGLALRPEVLEKPFKWRTPRRVFVNSMSDLWHDEVPLAFIAQVYAVMYLNERHTFQVLTKRPQRRRDWLKDDGFHAMVLEYVRLLQDARPTERRPHLESGGESLYGNVWEGVTVENQRWADERIPILLDTPAAVRFVSAEPLLGPVDLAASQGRYGSHGLVHNHRGHPDSAHGYLDVHWHVNGEVHGGHQPPTSGFSRKRAFKGNPWESHHHHDTTCESLLDWIIVGGESGPKHRAFDPAWARSIVAQCKDAGVACFVKQLGGARPGTELDDLPEDLRVREYPA